MKKSENVVKYLIGLFVVIGLRFVPHPPNVEPITASILPFSKKWGKISGFIFGVLAILFFDIITATLGTWTIVTSLSYGLIGVIGAIYFKNRQSSARNYVIFSVFATLFYDAVTGVGMSTVLFHQSFWISFTGQIPFTVNHLLGNVFLSAVVSPLIYRWILNNPRLETRFVVNKMGLVFSSK